MIPAVREDASFETLASDLEALFGRVATPLDDAAFDAWALRVFRWQYGRNATYRGYCDARGATPDAVQTSEDVPPVPTAAFKRLDLASLEPGRSPEAVFQTSGTTRQGRRGRHPVASLRLYRAASLPWFRAQLLPDGARMPVLALLPSPEEAPHSSLSRMMFDVAEALGAEGGGFFGTVEGGLREADVLAALRSAESARRPVLLAATAFGLVHWLDALARNGTRLSLPEGSRLMETGGFKGRSREVARRDLYEALRDRIGIPADHVVNEYGMTEMLSQFYEPVLSRRGAPSAADARWHVPPPWVRTRILDPITLEPVADGAAGLLCHHDLANAGSVAVVLTEDMGVRCEDGFRLLGRAPGAEPRGCSLATEALLESAASRRDEA